MSGLTGRKGVWTPERDARLLKLRKQGLTAALIAERFGLATNTVEGRLSQLGATRSFVQITPWGGE